MKLDKRILEGKRPLTCIDVEQAREFVGKECIFSDKYENFENLDKYLFVNSDYSAILSIDDTPKCGDYVFRNAKNAVHYGLILPLEWVKEPEKKYRPYSIAEFLKLYQVGDIVEFRAKNCDEFYRAMFIGYITNSNRSMDEKPGEIDVMLGNYLYSLSHLFEDHELFFEDEWQPFGVYE